MNDAEVFQESSMEYDMCSHGNFKGTCEICMHERKQTMQRESVDERATWLKEIEQSDPSIDWEIYIPEKQFGVVISLPHECFITATLNIDDEGGRSMYIDIFQVDPKLRGKSKGEGAGIGTRLLQTLIEQAKIYDVSVLSGHFTSKSALATLARVCGNERLDFYSHGGTKKVDKTFGEIMSESDSKNSGRIDYDVVSQIN